MGENKIYDIIAEPGKRLQPVLLIVPAVVAALACLNRILEGPFYVLGRLDPDYAYLMSALNVLHFQAPHFTDHPGTPLQVLSALIIFVRWFLVELVTGGDSVDVSVAKNPEAYLAAIQTTLSFIVAGCLYVLGRVVCRHAGGRRFAGVSAQAVFLLSPTFFVQLGRVKPECLGISIGILLSACVVNAVACRCAEAGVSERGHAVRIGVLWGVAVATKITFAPLVLLACLFRRHSDKAFFIVSGAAAFLVATLPIWRRYAEMLGWFTGNLFNAGRYGGGSSGVPDIPVLILNARKLFEREPSVYAALAIACWVTLCLLLPRMRAHVARSPAVRLSWIVLCVTALQLFLAVKGGGHPRYLVPSQVLFLALGGVLVCDVFMRAPRGGVGGRVPQALTLIVAVLLVVHSGRQFSSRTVNASQKWGFVSDQADALKANAGDTLTLVGYYQSVSVPFALAFGDEYAGRRAYPVLNTVYPDALFYRIWSGDFYDFGGAVSRDILKARLDAGEDIVFFGRDPATYNQSLAADLAVTQVMRQAGLSAFRIDAIQEPAPASGGCSGAALEE